MIGWPMLLVKIQSWFGDPWDPVTNSLNLDSFYFVWVSASIWLGLVGWIFITYLCIGKKSAIVLVMIYVAIYVSPLPMYLASDWDCGPIPEWKCRWTCKSIEELTELGISHDYWAGNPDVIKAGGFCE